MNQTHSSNDPSNPNTSHLDATQPKPVHDAAQGTADSPMSYATGSDVTLDGAQGATDVTMTFSEATDLIRNVRDEIHKVIVGQSDVITRVLVSLLAEGHCLIEGPPGLGKTKLLNTVAQTMGATMNRIQFTPDLLPSDIVGTRIWRADTNNFEVEFGPVFTNFLLADEINRAPAKVQSALLEAMAERQVTIGRQTYKLTNPFLVMATQNPVENEGVYQLPEAQRDRFLMRVVIDYPQSVTNEMEIVRVSLIRDHEVTKLMDANTILELQAITRNVYVDSAVAEYAARIVMATRVPANYGLPGLTAMIAFGASPRASISLIQSARAMAVLAGREFVEPQDVYDIAYDVLNHRVISSFDAIAEEVSLEEILFHILSNVPAPIAPKGTAYDR